LCYLRCFPFDRIKIARSFISDISEREDARAIVRAMVALGRNLGMKTLAEGVETPHQLEFLRSEACDEAQGFLFSKPLPAEAARLLARSFPCGGGMTERDSRPKHEPAAT
jgi:EAL domain-containing protein (putative c-di-GMP-specific phosphodiesterase class I)